MRALIDSSAMLWPVCATFSGQVLQGKSVAVVLVEAFVEVRGADVEYALECLSPVFAVGGLCVELG